MRNVITGLIIGLGLGIIVGLNFAPVPHHPGDRHGPPPWSNARANR